jgi:hypothetical protein
MSANGAIGITGASANVYASGAIGMTGNSYSLTTAGIQEFKTDLGSTAGFPCYIYTNTNGSTASYPAVKYDRPNATSVAGGVIASQSFWAGDTGGVSREYARMSVISQNIGPAANVDGTVQFQVLVNNVPNTILTLNGSSQEIEVGKNIDLNANSLTSSTSNLNISSAISPTAGATLTLATKDDVAGSGAGLVLTGNTLIGTTGGTPSANYLCITINGTVYKIALNT